MATFHWSMGPAGDNSKSASPVAEAVQVAYGKGTTTTSFELLKDIEPGSTRPLVIDSEQVLIITAIDAAVEFVCFRATGIDPNNPPTPADANIPANLKNVAAFYVPAGTSREVQARFGPAIVYLKDG